MPPTLEVRPSDATPRALFPLDRGRWLAGDVVADAIHALDLIDDSGGNTGQNLVWHTHPVGGHPVVAAHDTQGDRVVVGPLITHHPDGAHWQEDSKRLPNFVIPLGGSHFLDHDGIRFSNDTESLGRDVSDDANC